MSKSQLFSDLEGRPLQDVQRDYDDLRQKIENIEKNRKKMYLAKKTLGEVIKFAVNKITEPPLLEEVEHKELLLTVIEQKHEFDALLKQRNDVVDRLRVPRHRVLIAIEDCHRALTSLQDYTEAPNLATEITLFSRFFELQAMLVTYEEHLDAMSQLHTLRNVLLENVKDINREDRRYTQLLTKRSEGTSALRREAGRLQAYIKTQTGTAPQPLAEQIDEFGLRLLAGQSLSIEEFGALLEFGGLVELQSQELSLNEEKTKKTVTHRRADPLRGSTSYISRRRE